MGVAALSLHIPTTAADTDDQWYIACPFPGTWRIISAQFAPATAVTAHDTNYHTVVLATNGGVASTTWTDFGTFSTTVAGLGHVLGTVRDIAVSGAGQTISKGRQIRVSLTHPGSGQILDGTFTFALEKVN